MTSSSNKRKNSEGKEQKISRQKLDIQILHDAERAWLTDPIAAEQQYIREYEDTDSASSRLCLALIGKLSGKAVSPYTVDELLEECASP